MIETAFPTGSAGPWQPSALRRPVGKRGVVRILTLLLFCVFAVPEGWTQEQVKPSLTDPAIQQFDDPHLVLNGGPATSGAPLVVFLPGTGGRTAGAPRLLLETVASMGYRVVYLTYNDVPAVAQICPSQPPQCSADFREARSFGKSWGPVSNPVSEAIVSRLASLLRFLDREHPGDGWRGYLTADGSPAWPRIVLSGLSQGAGMAAYIAKRVPVRRVVLFSSPWDQTEPDRRLAPWLGTPSATPVERWWAERHAREPTTDLLARAYVALGISPGQILVFDGEPPAGTTSRSPYHTSTVRLPAYAPQWRVMFGRAG